MSIFITFEGGEGSGKTFQARALYKRLADAGFSVIMTHEPGGTSSGEQIARLLKWSEKEGISPLTELMLFNASRAQLLAEVIEPNLKSDRVVLCDRFTDSTIAYQSYGRGLDMELVVAINNAITGGLKPELAILLDMPVEYSLARTRNRRNDRFEKEDIDFHNRVRQGFIKLATAEPERWLVVDAGQSKQKISDIIWERVKTLI